MTTAQLTKDQLLELVTQQQERIEALENQVRYLVTKQYGTKSEKVSADQLALFETDSETASQEEDADEEKVQISFERKRRGKRRKLDESLERHTIEYELSEADKACDCGDHLEPVATKTSEQYEYIP
ncbi:hypothetical protein GWO43_08610, partial [candidate division KSB1 bacterium]|nr:hypothetical protein [candidate division KSB1 bacterium]NIS24015.1 hypothetical protein [candidate division KSB1 bacterium]NIT70942.1 hypothetical protein [candidate division KSB1 bacterium]NIU24665.1 hypothetical protein [candidate division KSB1 bacterium]NIU89723.1 hypothetical protein [candidate division KSB1 bacterium]